MKKLIKHKPLLSVVLKAFMLVLLMSLLYV